MILKINVPRDNFDFSKFCIIICTIYERFIQINKTMNILKQHVL